MSIGTKEGTEAEIRLVKKLNSDKNSGLWDVLDFIRNRENTYAVHVIYHQLSSVSNRNVKPKADVFLASGRVPADSLEDKAYYLNEDDIAQFNLTKIDGSGISVKMPDSSKYQIHKFPPNTFNKVFGSYELGAGMSVYCSKAAELYKNDGVINGWKTTWENFEEYFRSVPGIKSLKDNSIDADTRLKIAKQVKKQSKTKIEKDVSDNPDVSDFVFKGIGTFQEPYSVHWLYAHGELTADTRIPFNATTGSGRSKGVYTVVIKPK